MERARRNGTRVARSQLGVGPLGVGALVYNYTRAYVFNSTQFPSGPRLRFSAADPSEAQVG
jgi:hypothetical protein